MNPSQVKYIDLSEMGTYPDYKDSGVEWIGEIPNDWKLTRIKNIFVESKNKVGCKSSLYDVLSLTIKGVIVRNLENNKGKIPESFDGYQIVQKNNIVFCLFDMDVTPRIVGHAKQEGIITSAYTVVKNKTQISMKYYYYYFLEQNRNKSLLAHSKSLRSTLTFDAFGLLPVPQPSYEEQCSIAIFLDRETFRIDTLIEKKQQFVKLLEERREALISHIVTRGLDSAVPMKDSGIEWIGKIPKEWDVTRLKHVCDNITDGSHYSPSTQEKGYPYITVQNVKNNEIDFNNCGRISEDDYKSLTKNGCKPQIGDILLTKDGTIGKAVVIDSDRDFVILSSLGLITPNKSAIYSKYLKYYLISSINVDQMFSFIRGSALTRLTIKLIKELMVVIPPISEQQTIANYLDQEKSQIDNLIEKTKQSIEYLKEYRSALISDAVTGKIDVRGAVSD